MSNNFDFAKQFTPDIAVMLNFADDYLHLCKDPHGCMLKVGSATEYLVVSYIAVKQLLVSSFEPKPTFRECIELLEKIGSCPKEIIQAIKYIWNRRNRASHEVWNKEYDANECLKQAHKILSWYVTNFETVTLFG